MKLVSIASLLLFAGLASFAPFRAAPGGEACARAAAAEKRFDHESVQRLIFYAVLEGLYEDGVDNESVDAIVALDKKSQYTVNFVWGCPICMPAFEALKAYRARPAFSTRKTGGDTFGPGLDEPTRLALKSSDHVVRQQRIQELVQSWVSRRRDALRLNAEENVRLQAILEEMAKKGMGLLDEYRSRHEGEAYQEMKECPFCKGATAKR